MVGLTNGSVSILCYNGNLYAVCQLLNTTHQTIKEVTASPVRMAVCG